MIDFFLHDANFTMRRVTPEEEEVILRKLRDGSIVLERGELKNIEKKLNRIWSRWTSEDFPIMMSLIKEGKLVV